MGMSSVVGIAKSYFLTLTNQRTGKIRVSPLVVQFGAPIAIGTICFFVGPLINSPNNAIVGISIVSALLCAMATMLFQIRMSLRASKKAGEDCFVTEKDLKLVDELFVAVLWTILFGLAVVLFMVVLEWLGVYQLDDCVGRCSSALQIAFITHFVFVIGVVLKRLNRVYELVAIQKR